MPDSITVGVICPTSDVGRSVLAGLFSSHINFTITVFTKPQWAESEEIKRLRQHGIRIHEYDLNNPMAELVIPLSIIDTLISCLAWLNLPEQYTWIAAAKQAGVKRFVPSEWATPAPPGVIDSRAMKLQIQAELRRVRLPYTIIDVGCWYQVFVPAIPSGRIWSARSVLMDDRIVDDGEQKFAMIDMRDIGKYVAQIIVDIRTLNAHVFAYTEVLSMNEIWNTMAAVSGETPEKGYVTSDQIRTIIDNCNQRLEASIEGPVTVDTTFDMANVNMGQFRLSWFERGENTPQHAEYLGYLDFWKLFPFSREVEASMWHSASFSTRLVLLRIWLLPEAAHKVRRVLCILDEKISGVCSFLPQC